MGSREGKITERRRRNGTVTIRSTVFKICNESNKYFGSKQTLKLFQKCREIIHIHQFIKFHKSTKNVFLQEWTAQSSSH